MAQRYHLKRRNIQAIRFLQTSTHSPFYSVFVGFVKISEYFSRHPSFHFRQFTSFYLAKQGVQMKIFFLLNIPMFVGFWEYFENIFRLFTIHFPHLYPPVYWIWKIFVDRWKYIPLFNIQVFVGFSDPSANDSLFLSSCLFFLLRKTSRAKQSELCADHLSFMQ